MLRLFIWVLVIVAVMAATVPTADAQTVKLNSATCTLPNAGDVSLQEALAANGQFTCDKGKFETPAKHYWVKAEIDDLVADIADPVMRVRVARQGDFELHVAYADSPTKTLRYTSDEVKANWRGPSHTAFPLIGPNGEMPISIVLGVDKPWDPWNLADITVMPSDEDAALHTRSYIADAVFCALLLAPFVLHLVFYLLLRIRFILFHLVGISAMLVTQVLWGGIIFDLVPAVDIVTRSALAHMAIAVLTCAACLLIRDLIDLKYLGPTAHRALLWAGFTTVALTSAVLVVAPLIPVYGSLVFHFGILLAVIAAVGSLIVAAVRKSWIAWGLLLGTTGFSVIAIIRILNSMGLFVGLPTFDYEFYAAAFLDSIIMSIIVVGRALQMRKERDLAVLENALLFKTARTDPLTGLLNRRALEETFAEITQQPERRRQHWAMAVIDIDHFKRINDLHGHDGGDLCLQQFSQLLKETCRDGDYCARIGGEEFVILLSINSLREAEQFGERLRLATEQQSFGTATASVTDLTISIGIARIPRLGTQTFETVYRSADQALYAAKTNGRNRVIIAGTEPAKTKQALARSA